MWFTFGSIPGDALNNYYGFGDQATAIEDQLLNWVTANSCYCTGRVLYLYFTAYCTVSNKKSKFAVST